MNIVVNSPYRVPPRKVDLSMKKTVLIAGAIVLIVGGVLAATPVSNQSVARDTYATMTGPVFEFPGPFDVINPSIAYTASWSSSSGTSITVTALDCGPDPSCASHSIISNASGTSGSLSWSGTKGRFYAVTVSHSATVTVTASLPLAAGEVGFILLVFGIVVLVIGSVPRVREPLSRRRARPSKEEKRGVRP